MFSHPLIIGHYFPFFVSKFWGPLYTVLFKYNGVELFCRFSTPVFNKLQNISDFKTSTIETLLKDTFDNLEGEYAGLGHPDWWLSGTGLAGGLNAAALGRINHELTKALHKVESESDIQL